MNRHDFYLGFMEGLRRLTPLLLEASRGGYDAGFMAGVCQTSERCKECQEVCSCCGAPRNSMVAPGDQDSDEASKEAAKTAI
jgi:hypothetical protein